MGETETEKTAIDDLPVADVATWPARLLSAVTAVPEDDIEALVAASLVQRMRYRPAGPSGSEDEMIRWLGHFRGAASVHDDSNFDPRLADWREDAALPIGPFLALVGNGTRRCWTHWFADECAHARADGREGYAELLLEEVEEEVILVELADGRVDIWDGWHRLAATIVKGRATIMAVVGRPYAEANTGAT